MSNKPSHYLNVVTGEDENAQFTRITPLWATSKGGYAGNIPAGVSITGRIVITAAKSRDENGGQQ